MSRKKLLECFCSQKNTLGRCSASVLHDEAELSTVKWPCLILRSLYISSLDRRYGSKLNVSSIDSGEDLGERRADGRGESY